MKKKTPPFLKKSDLDKLTKTLLSQVLNDVDTGSYPNSLDIVNNNKSGYDLDIEKLDKWCSKILKENTQVKYIKNQRYPYSNYSQLENLLKRYGKDIISYLKSNCPIRQTKISDISDSLAYSMFGMKVDPYSILEIPSFSSTWEKISDNIVDENNEKPKRRRKNEI